MTIGGVQLLLCYIIKGYMGSYFESRPDDDLN